MHYSNSIIIHSFKANMNLLFSARYCSYGSYVIGREDQDKLDIQTPKNCHPEQTFSFFLKTEKNETV